MKQVLLAAALAAGLAFAAQADVATGGRAYLAGDYAKALNELMPLARQGEAEAQYLIGVMHAHGQGVERNYPEAESWYRQAAEQGHEQAAFSLGFMSYNGAGEGDNAVAQDYAKALPWLKIAAAAGNAMAQTMLGAMYYEGRGVERDAVTAAKLFLTGAEKGIARAQYAAALMLAQGDGVERDRVAAYAWFTLLAETGYPGAAKNRDTIAATLTKDQLVEGQARARDARQR